VNTRHIKRLAGWFTVTFGTGHLLGSGPLRLDAWARSAEAGLLSADVITPQDAVEREAAEAYWFSLGSFGAPTLLLGAYIVWAAGRDVRIPGALGWGLAAWGAVMVAFMPLSPAMLMPAAGLMIVVADRRETRRSTGSSPLQAAANR
jgi:hypothetical protein